MSSLLLLLVSLLAVADGLRYNYGDGSYYIGEVDSETGRPSGNGRFYNTTGDLGMGKVKELPKSFFTGLWSRTKESSSLASTNDAHVPLIFRSSRLQNCRVWRRAAKR